MRRRSAHVSLVAQPAINFLFAAATVDKYAGGAFRTLCHSFGKAFAKQVSHTCALLRSLTKRIS